LVHSQGEEIGVGDLAVMKQQLSLQLAISGPGEEVRPEQVAWNQR
jgi:hypothetical protein